MKRFSINFLVIFLTAVMLLSCNEAQRNPYQDKMNLGVEYSLKYRNDSSGVWNTAGWWNSANILTALVRYAEVSGEVSKMSYVVNDVYQKAKHYELKGADGKFICFFDSFINDFYDDEGWWALAWIKAFEVFGNTEYLEMAKAIFADMTTGWDESLGGGIYWKKNPLEYKNSIANNLFALTAIRLYKLTKEDSYLEWFIKEVNWYLSTGLYNKDRQIIEDGISKEGYPNREGHYTYNQGVAIAVFTEMYLYSNDKKYLEIAMELANAAITKEFVTTNGILIEKRPDIAEGNDGVQFKGIFIRHLSLLYNITKNEDYKKFILSNANSILNNNFDSALGSFGCHWEGPFIGKEVASNSSALECIIEAFVLFDE